MYQAPNYHYDKFKYFHNNLGNTLERDFIFKKDLELGYYLTRPMIDKICFYHTLGKDSALIPKLRMLAEIPSKNYKCSVNEKNKSARSKYRIHYKISLGEKKYKLDFFCDPRGFGEKKKKDKELTKPDYRFCKFEFSLFKYGREGILALKEFYEEVFEGRTFKDFLENEEVCTVGKIELAVDIIGLHIADVTLNVNEDKFSVIYQTTKGRAATIYNRKVKSKTSSFRFYNKLKEISYNSSSYKCLSDFYLHLVKEKIPNHILYCTKDSTLVGEVL